MLLVCSLISITHITEGRIPRIFNLKYTDCHTLFPSMHSYVMEAMYINLTTDLWMVVKVGPDFTSGRVNVLGISAYQNQLPNMAILVNAQAFVNIVYLRRWLRNVHWIDFWWFVPQCGDREDTVRNLV